MGAQNAGERIKNRRTALGLSQSAVAILCGWPDSHTRIAKYENNQRKLSSDVAAILAKSLNTTPEWLMFGSGEAELGDSGQKGALEAMGEVVGYIPLIGWDEVGTFVEVFDLMDKSKESLEKKWQLIPIAVPLGKRCFALKIKDSAMTSPQGGVESFSTGNMLFADPDKEHKNGSYVLTIMGNGEEAVLKKYVLQGGKKYLISLNPAYPPIEFTRSMVIKAKVIANTTFFE